MGSCCSSTGSTVEAVNTQRSKNAEESKTNDLTEVGATNVSSVTIPFPQVAIFANGLYQVSSSQDPNEPNYEKNLFGSSFNTTILWRLGISDTGDLIYNDSVNTLVSNGELTQQYINSELSNKLSSLKTNHGINVLSFSIGSGSYEIGNKLLINPDWLFMTNIILHKFSNLSSTDAQKLEEQLYTNFGILINTLGINAIDSDCEEWNWWTEDTHELPSGDGIVNTPVRVNNDDIQTAHIKLFTTLYQRYGINTFSFSPFVTPLIGDYWINVMKGCIITNNNGNSEQLIKFINTQQYSNGDASSWITWFSDNYNSVGFNNGNDAIKLLLPAYMAYTTSDGKVYYQHTTASQVEINTKGLNDNAKTAIKGEICTIGGGCMWNLPDMTKGYNYNPSGFKGNDASDYSTAIRNGMQ